MIDDILFQERIYDLANGFLELSRDTVPESEFVMDEFAVGSPCHASYEKVLAAYARVCDRLRCGQEDADVEIILNEMNAISRHMALKMFQYGVFFARRQNGL